MSKPGHNEATVRLAAMAGDAQIALDRVAYGEAEAIEGWLAYGAALNEGRALFAKDADFGKWVADFMTDNLSVTPNDHERAAAMWAAANRDQFDEARAAGKARTVRGIHEKSKQIEAEREKAIEEAKRKADENLKRMAAESARKEAEEQAKVEVQARKAAAEAKTDDDRNAAEIIVTKAAEAKVKAEKIADEAEADLDAPKENQDVADLRKTFRKLTAEAQEADFIDLHLTVRDKNNQIVTLKAELADLKSWWDAANAGTDTGRALGAAKMQVRTADGRMKEHQAAAARLQRQVNAQAVEIKKLRAELENQVIPL